LNATKRTAGNARGNIIAADITLQAAKAVP